MTTKHNIHNWLRSLLSNHAASTSPCQADSNRFLSVSLKSDDEIGPGLSDRRSVCELVTAGEEVTAAISASPCTKNHLISSISALFSVSRLSNSVRAFSRLLASDSRTISASCSVCLEAESSNSIDGSVTSRMGNSLSADGRESDTNSVADAQELSTLQLLFGGIVAFAFVLVWLELRLSL